MTSILEQIELAWHFNPGQPRGRDGKWIKIGPSGVLPASQRFGMGHSTIERVRRAKIEEDEEEERARVLRARGLGPESIREALYARRKEKKLKADVAAAIRPLTPAVWGQVDSGWGKPDSNARANKAMGWPSEYNRQLREAQEQVQQAREDAERLAREDKFRAAGIAAQAERNAMVPPPWTPTAELRQLQHDNRRAALQTWTVDEQGQIIRGAHPGVHGQGILADLVKRKSVTGQWKFIHGGNREVTEPQVGDMARMPLGGPNNQVGTVISVAGGHAVIDSADDGMRYLVDWRNGGRVVRKDPIPGGWQSPPDNWSPPPWINTEDTPSPDLWTGSGVQERPDGTRVVRDPHPPNGSLAPWLVRTPNGAEFHVSTKNKNMMFPRLRSASPPGVVTGPGVKQLIFPGMPEPEQDVGHTSAPVRHLLDEISGDALEEGESANPVEDRGQQAQTSIVTLPDGVKVVHKQGQPKGRADAEELSYYVSQVIDAHAPALARVPGTNADLVEDFIPGETGGRYLNEADDYDAAEEALKTSEQGQKIALLDRLISNSDRNTGNWMVDADGTPFPIDHGQAEFDGEDYGGENDDGSYDHWVVEPLSADYVNELRGRLEALEPEFIRLGREDWYEGMIQALGKLPIEGMADDSDSWRPVTSDYATISGQVLELGWRYNPAEKRDERGRWTTGGKSYTVPDPARLYVKPNKSPVNYPHPEDHPFFKAHPVSPANVVRAYQASTDQEKAQGMRWYADAHLLAGKMADGDARKGAILLASYSSQVTWPVDMFNAARAAEENRALGPGDGMISGDMQKNAQEALDGASVEEALQAPKTLAFARLIEHGGDEPDDEHGQVAVDRHALSVAMGERLPDKTQVPIGKTRYHEYVADQYREAARQLSAQGTVIAPHQLQAVTWIHQLTANQAVNTGQAADTASEEYARAKGRATMLRNAWAKWMKYARAEGLPLQPGTTSLANVSSGDINLAQVVSDWLDAVELAVWEHELRDTRGRWTRFGGVGRAAETAEKNREGFSVSVRTGEAPPSGYMVAQTDHTHVFPASILDDHARLTRAIDDMIMAEKSAFAGKQAYLGGWVHDGKLWLEPSDNFDNKYEAVAAGKARNQISIFDLQTYDEIQTGGHGGGRITEHANPQDAGQGPGGLRGHARGRAAGSGSRAGHGDSVWDQVLLAWHFNPAEKRDRLGKWARSEGFSSETIANGRMYVRLQGEAAAARDKGWVDIAGNLSVATDAMRRGNADGFVAAAGYVDYAIEIAEDAGHIADAKRYRKYASQLRSMGDAPQVGTAGAAVKDLLSKVCPEISGLYGGGHESWNGQVTVFPQEDNPGVIGELTWAGRMNIEEGAARSIQKVLEDPDAPVKDPASLEVVLHELTHGLIGGGEAKVNKRREELGLPPKSPERYYEHLDAYQELPVAQIEEGFTELGGIQHAPEFFDKIGIGDRPTTIPSGFARRRHLTLNDLARQYQNPSAIEQGAAWGHYGWQTKMAQDWTQQVAKDEGYKDLRSPGERGYDRAHELADEVNREGPAGKVAVMADQVVRAALKNTPEAALLDDQDALDKVLASTRHAIVDAWAGEEAARDAHRAAVKTAHSTAHTVRMARLAGDTVEVGAEGIPITWKKAG